MLETFSFYTHDFLHGRKLAGLGSEAKGILASMWCICARDGAVSDDPFMVARQIGEDPEVVQRHWLRLLPLFKMNRDGSLYARRIQEEREHQSDLSLKRRAAGIAGNQARWARPQQTIEMAEPKIHLAEIVTEMRTLGVLPQAPKPRRKRPQTPVELTDLKSGSFEPFEEVWMMWPMRVSRQDEKTKQWSIVDVERGNRARAERAFQRIVDAGAATPELLYYCAFAYLKNSSLVKKGYVQHVSTFYGTELRTWSEFVEMAKKLQEEANNPEVPSVG